jgi:hypothetical protein
MDGGVGSAAMLTMRAQAIVLGDAGPLLSNCKCALPIQYEVENKKSVIKLKAEGP